MKKRRHDSYSDYKRKNLFHRTTPWLIVIGCIAAAAALGWGAYRFISTRPVTEEKAVYEAIGESSFPTLSMEYNGRMINSLCAYSDEMDLNYAGEAIYLLEDTYEIPIEIVLNGNSASGVDFYLYEMTSSSLIQNGSSGEITTQDDILSTSVVLAQQVVTNDTEYVLDIALTLSGGTVLHYYTRVMRSSGTYTSDQIELAYSFAQATIDKDEDAITSYMETNPWTQSNTNFSGVNLKSSISQMTWQSLEVSLVSEMEITIVDINETIGCYRLDYILARADGDETEYYRVSDYFRIRTGSSVNYILSYERTVDEIFVPSEDVLSASSAELGILSADEIETASSSDGYFSCFVIGGTLWEIDSSAKEIVEVFSFEASEASLSEAVYYNHEIKILSVDDSGDIEFLVYGYMNAGLHEGLCGVGLYSYSSGSGQTTEKLFIQADIPYEVLKETTGDMVYVSGDNVLYVLIDQTIYSISLDDYSMDTVAQDLVQGSYKVSLDGGMIAWQENGSINDAGKITVFDADSASELTISASEGCSIKVLGFIGDDVAYGQGTDGNYYYDESDEQYLLMDTVFVKDLSGETESEYSAQSGYYLSAEYEYNRIIISDTEGQELTVYSSEISAVETPELSSSYEDTKETVYYIGFIKSTTSSGEFTITLNSPVYVSDYNLVSRAELFDLSERYLVYGKGSLQMITSSAAQAVALAYEYEGYVKTGEGYFYRRGMRPASIAMSDSAIESALSEYEDGNATLITGITLTQAMYFTGEGIALFWVYDGQTYLIYGYDSGDDLLVYNVETGENSEIDDTEAEDAFDNSEGSLYVVIS